MNGDESIGSALNLSPSFDGEGVSATPGVTIASTLLCDERHNTAINFRMIPSARPEGVVECPNCCYRKMSPWMSLCFCTIV